jgi:hypothetical protein
MNREQKLEAMWELTSDIIIASLQNPDTATPGMVQCALRFLQDNGAESLVLPNTKKDQIKKLLPFPKLARDERKLG